MITTRNSVDALIAALASVDVSRTAPSTIEGLLRDARIDDENLTPYVHFVDGKYTRNCVYRDDRFELLVLCWSASAQSAVHDHGASRCFMKIARGSLSVNNYTIVAGGRRPGLARLAHAQQATLHAGDIDTRNSAHDIHHVTACAGDAVSLHVYAKPLDRCLIFDLSRQSCSIAVSRYHTRPTYLTV